MSGSGRRPRGRRRHAPLRVVGLEPRERRRLPQQHARELVLAGLDHLERRLLVQEQLLTGGFELLLEPPIVQGVRSRIHQLLLKNLLSR